MHIIIASTNPVKVNATKKAFEQMFPGENFSFQSLSVPSGVSHQPVGNEETYKGALTRALNAKKHSDQAEYWIGIEGGIEALFGDVQAFAWVVILHTSGTMSKAKTATFPLPKQVIELINQGKEMGEADDIVFNKVNTKQTTGAIGILTDNIIDRTAYYTDAIILALIPYKHSLYYEDRKSTL